MTERGDRYPNHQRYERKVQMVTIDHSDTVDDRGRVGNPEYSSWLTIHHQAITLNRRHSETSPLRRPLR